MSDVWIWTFGEIGKVMRGQLREGKVAVDLSQFTSVKWTAKRSITGAAFSGMPILVTPDADQTQEIGQTGKGWFTYTTESVGAAVPISSGDVGYYLSFIATDNGSHAHYFPVNRRGAQTYAKLIIRAVP